MRRVAILGSGGAGKSWLATELGRRLGIAPVHLDALYYDARWRPTAPERWEQVQRELIAEERWIIDGNHLATMPIRLAAADTIVLLDTPTLRRLARILRRRIARSGPARPDVLGAERLTWSFVRYVAAFDRVHRPRVLAAIDAHGAGARVEILHTPADARRLLSSATRPPWFVLEPADRHRSDGG